MSGRGFIDHIGLGLHLGLGSYRNTYVTGIYLICIRSRVGISVRLGMWDLCQGQSWLGSYRNAYVRGIYLICIRSIVGISVSVSDLGLMSGSELVLPSELLAVRL